MFKVIKFQFMFCNNIVVLLSKFRKQGLKSKFSWAIKKTRYLLRQLRDAEFKN